MPSKVAPLYVLGRQYGPRYRRANESFATYIERVDTPLANAERELFNRWFAEYAAFAPADSTPALRRHLRGSNQTLYRGAWWELYLFWFLKRSGVLLEVSPQVEGGRPDFLVEGHGEKWYIEASNVLARQHNENIGKLLDAIQSWEQPELWVDLNFEQSPSRPNIEDLVGRIKTIASQPGFQGAPPTPFVWRSPPRDDWEVRVVVLPRSPEEYIGVSVLGNLSMRLEPQAEVIERINERLRAKSNKYRTLRHPLALAINSEDRSELDSLYIALYGFDQIPPEKAFWATDQNPQVKCILGTTGLDHFTIARPGKVLEVLPRNEASALPTPWGDRALWQKVVTTPPAKLLDLPPEWPDPFYKETAALLNPPRPSQKIE